MKKAYFLIVLFLCGLSVGNLFASASAAAAAEEAAARALIKAVRDGEEKVGELIADGANVNAQNSLGQTALMYAVTQRGRLAIVKRLLKVEGIDVNLADFLGYTALIYAAVNGHTAIVELLLQKEANLNDQDGYGNTALMQAARKGHTATVELLLQEGADKNIQNNRGDTAANMARNDEIAKMISDFVLPSGRLTKAAR